MKWRTLSLEDEIQADPGNSSGQDLTGVVAKEHMLPFHVGWTRDVVSRIAPPNRAEIYYLSPDRKTKLRLSVEAAKHFQENPMEHLSADNFSWKQKPLGLNNPQLERVRTAKPQSPRRVQKLPLPNFHPEVYHDQPGDISKESWGTIDKTADINANISNLGAEHKTYGGAGNPNMGNTAGMLENQKDLEEQIRRCRAETLAVQSKSTEKIRRARETPVKHSPGGARIKHTLNNNFPQFVGPDPREATGQAGIDISKGYANQSPVHYYAHENPIPDLAKYVHVKSEPPTHTDIKLEPPNGPI